MMMMMMMTTMTMTRHRPRRASFRDRARSTPDARARGREHRRASTRGHRDAGTRRRVARVVVDRADARTTTWIAPSMRTVDV